MEGTSFDKKDQVSSVFLSHFAKIFFTEVHFLNSWLIQPKPECVDASIAVVFLNWTKLPWPS